MFICSVEAKYVEKAGFGVLFNVLAMQACLIFSLFFSLDPFLT